MRITINEPCKLAGCIANARTLEQLRHRQMERHSLESKKWKNSAYYFQEKCKRLELMLLEAQKKEKKESDNGQGTVQVQENSE